MNMKRLIITILMGVAFAFGTFQTPAQAVVPTTVDANGLVHTWSAPRLVGETPKAAVARSMSQCTESPKMCMWKDYMFSGSLIYWNDDGTTLCCGKTLVNTGFNNTISSWWNRSYGTIRIMDSNNCVWGGGYWYRDLTTNQSATTTPTSSDWDNRTSSFDQPYDYNHISVC